MPLRIKVVPGASRSEIVGWLGDELKIRVAAPPEGGKANRAVVKLLAEALNIPAAQFEIVSGKTRARKTVDVAGMDGPTLRARLSRDAI